MSKRRQNAAVQVAPPAPAPTDEAETYDNSWLLEKMGRGSDGAGAAQEVVGQAGNGATMMDGVQAFAKAAGTDLPGAGFLGAGLSGVAVLGAAADASENGLDAQNGADMLFNGAGVAAAALPGPFGLAAAAAAGGYALGGALDWAADKVGDVVTGDSEGDHSISGTVADGLVGMDESYDRSQEGVNNWAAGVVAATTPETDQQRKNRERMTAYYNR